MGPPRGARGRRMVGAAVGDSTWMQNLWQSAVASQRSAPLQTMLYTCVLLGAAGGWVCGVPGLANTATTFTVLWLVEKYAELHLEARWNGWFLLLFLSLSAYKGALWMHDHPAFVASMFGSS